MLEKSFQTHVNERRKFIKRMHPLIITENDCPRYPLNREKIEDVREVYHDLDTIVGLKPRVVSLSGMVNGVVYPTLLNPLVSVLQMLRTRYSDRFLENYTPTFVDLGANDARVVVIAALLGWKSYGIERDGNAYRQGKIMLEGLERRHPELGNARLVHGDYFEQREIGDISFHSVDFFFNYDDTNVLAIGRKLRRDAKPGALFVLETYKCYYGQMPLRLEAVLQHDLQEDLPTFDIFRKD